MIDGNPAQNQGQESTDSPLLGAFSLPDNFYGDKPETPGDGANSGPDNGAEGGTPPSEGSGETETGDPDGSDGPDSETGETPAPDSDPDKGGGTEEVTVSSVTELIESQEWDPEWFNGLKVPVKVDGQAAEATIKDLVDGYQMREAAEKRLEEAKTKAKALNQELADKSKALETQYATAAGLIQQAEKLLEEDVGNIDWKRLREDDPAEYSAKKEEVRERRERIDRMKSEARESYQNALAERQAEFEQHRRERLAAEREALLEKIPEWRDAEKMKAEQAKLARYLIEQGFSEQDVRQASDHRLIVFARKAMRHDETEGRADAAKKKVAKIPKTLKPGAKSSEAPKPQLKDAAEILYG